MEGQDQPTTLASTATAKPAKKSNQLAIILVLAVLAVAGIVFGGYTLAQNAKKDDSIKNLQAQVEKISKKAAAEAESNSTTIEEPKELNTTQQISENKVAPVTVAGGPYIKNGYFYVPEWGFKFKIPSDLAGLGFSVDYDEARVGYDLPFIGFTAVQKSDLVANPQAQYYDNIQSCSIIAVNKTLKSSDNYKKFKFSNYAKETNEYVLAMSELNSQACSFNRNTDKVYAKLKAMFLNPEKM